MSYSDETLKIEVVEKKLVDEGIADTHEIVFPMDNQLQIDIDSTEMPPRFEERLNILLRAMDGPVHYKTYVSRHGRRHVVIDLPRTVSQVERIAWQAALSSDPMRGCLGLLRLSKGIEKGTLLIHRKDGSDVLATAMLEPVGRKFR